MPLRSRLFRGDPKLEAAAVSDPAHITTAASGGHVRKIQTALIRLTKVFLATDGIYGPKTAAAVVAFKEAQVPPLRQPGQSLADKIVGIRTIMALDYQMEELEDFARPMTGFVSLTPFGSPHDHDHDPRCKHFLDSDDFEGRISHLGTPIKPQRFGRMVCIGGTNEVKYLGFENFVPDPTLDNDMKQWTVMGRPFTTDLPDHSVSDICFRSAPVDRFMKTELKRIAMPGCRLTYASNVATVIDAIPFLLSLGPLIQSEIISDQPPANIGDTLNINSILQVAVIKILNIR